MDTIDLDEPNQVRLRKLLALFDSPHVGEGRAALQKASELLKRHGWTLVDIPEVLGNRLSASTAASTGASSQPNTPVRTADPFAGFKEFKERQESGYKVHVDAERACKSAEEVAYRAAIIEKYGSLRAALANTAIERALETAFVGMDASEALDEFAQLKNDSDDNVFVTRARTAWPFPKSLTEAKQEYDFWEERERERAAVKHYHFQDGCLSAACELRRSIVSDLLMGGMPARSAKEALLRVDYLENSGLMWADQEINAVKRDLEQLANLESASVQYGRSATSRRVEIEGLITDPATTGLTDREIARRVGASPQTVGNIRRRLKNERA